MVLGTETQISQDGDFPHWEVMMAVNPRNPMNLLASAITEEPNPTRKGWDISAYGSGDGGKSWTRTFKGEKMGDPIVAFGATGTSYLASLHTEGGQLVGVARSEYGERTWLPRSTVFSDGSKADHPMIAVDRSGGPFTGRVYIGAQYSSGRILVHRSNDDGRTFETAVAVRVSDRGFVDNLAIFSDGTVFVPFKTRNIFRTSADGRFAGSTSEYASVISSDGGQTFSAPRPIFTRVSELGGMHGANNAVFGIGRYRGKDRVYAVWSDTRAGNARVRLLYSDDKGESWSAIRRVTADSAAVTAESACNVAVSPEGVVGISWLGFKDKQYDAYFTASTDGGVTFSAPVRLSTRSSSPASNSARYPGGDYMLMAAAPGNTFHTIWPDARGSNFQVFTRTVRVQ